MNMRVVTSVAITDPLVKYQSLVATGVCSPDASQHPLAHHLQKIYLRLKDYEPAQEYRRRLHQVTQVLDQAKPDDEYELASRNHPIRRYPLFARLALTRVLTSHQAALHADSPKGLFLSGEVGTGKSMLLDLLAEGLPTRGKKRWHFNTFMLHAFSRLEQFRKSQPQAAGGVDLEYSLLWIAKEMVEKTSILFLDEFQLPDRAASKIMNNLFLVFFQLGGVLIASSNQMPEELEKATGVSYSPPLTGGLFEQVLGLRRRRLGGELFGKRVLKARCDFWHMEGAHDWRRREVQSDSKDATVDVNETSVLEQEGSVSEDLTSWEAQKGSQRPVKYILASDTHERWAQADQHDVSNTTSTWKPSTLTVYGRKVVVPRQKDGTAHWKFIELVSSFGPADYITLASNYHTFIIDQNEARRFITLLDTLYEARCKLIIRVTAGPDDLFFPETRVPPSPLEDGQPSSTPVRDDVVDATYSETIAEVFQDQMSPFRPNISTYLDSRNAKYDPDQDSDFGLEPNKEIDFNQTGAFTGEDERFAYKRATSRLWELCSSQWHARTGDWWQPLPDRHWEGTKASEPHTTTAPRSSLSEITMGPTTELEESAGLERFAIAMLKKRGR
ncbi:AFG1-like ATPase-domain-containing protein [Apodospora peruviana]|uniref:AFG1-like ATPase-domain-containing protein n=1 Tax=Apodospora peruviana TaxID=516989 RepID=A0AAE0M2B6_9PEZI|nr:AFG1-like ATPase-domain-containing protein [Apodospora peruviana]